MVEFRPFLKNGKILDEIARRKFDFFNERAEIICPKGTYFAKGQDG